MKIIFVLSLFAFFTFFQKSHAAQIDTVKIYSPSMSKSVPCIVILPDAYRATAAKPYPVLYLLHGWSGDYADWLKDAAQLPGMADRFQMIIVCPDGGYDSWYIDSPVDSTVRYDTHLAQEVVGYVDYYYRTRASPSGRAISGLSMGGHGALLLAIRHPEVFGAAGSMCGGLDLRPFAKNRWQIKNVLGDPVAQAANWTANSVVAQAPRLKGRNLPLLIDCGLGDFFLPVNRDMHRVLLENDIPHEYTERPGQHNQAYWGSAIDFQILFFYKFFTQS